MVNDYTKYRNAMRAIGIPVLVIGIILLIFSFVNFAGGNISGATGNMITFALGAIMLVIGFGLIRLSIVRPLSKYYASEGSPGIKIASKSIGDGLKESNVFSDTKKEIIKIKCPNCGYLESEDAEFCSKCGKKI